MKVIHTKHEDILVDDFDYEYLKNITWSIKKGKIKYAQCILNNKCYLMHNIIIGKKTGLDIDHINGNGLDNRKVNLRHVTRSINLLNQHTKRLNTSSKYIGVSFDKSRNKWRSSIKLNNKFMTIGRYDTEIEAYNIYNKIKKCYFSILKI